MIRGEFTTEELLAQVGGDVTRRQLERWQKEGLIPSPRRRGLGRAKGTVSLYPPVAVPMLQRLVTLTQESGDLADWRWQLWLDGYPVDLSKLRDHLIGQFDRQMKQVRGTVATLNPEENDGLGVIEALLKLPATRRNRFSPLLRRLRKRADRDGVMVFMLSYLVGGEPPVGWDDPIDDDGRTMADLFGTVFGIPAHWERSGEMPELVSLAQLRSIMKTTSDADLRELRRDWQAIIGAAGAFARVQEIVDQANVVRSELQQEDVNAWDQLDRVRRSWIADVLDLLDEPYIRAALSAALVHLRRIGYGDNIKQITSSLRFFAGAIRAADMDTPSRRVQPSEGTASGRTSSRCTPMISTTETFETAS